MSLLQIDADSEVPPFEQLKQQLTTQIDTGALTPGDKLPTVRRLAADLGLAPNTVARAYRELEVLGVLHTRGRAGTFVAGDQTQREARQAARDYADRVTAMGLPRSEAITLVERAFD